MAVLIVVRRGAEDRFRFLNEKFGHEAVIIWDRRRADRRRHPTRWPRRERRLRNRRHPPPTTWEALHFVVAGGALPE